MIIMVLAADQEGLREVDGEEIEGSLSHVETELMVASPKDVEATGQDLWTEGDSTAVIRQRYESPAQNRELFLCSRICAQVRPKEQNMRVRGRCHHCRKPKGPIPHCSLGPRSCGCQTPPSQEQEPKHDHVAPPTASHHSLRADMHNITKQFIKGRSGGRSHLSDSIR